jgi:two-component system, OmpR family, response regulator
MRILVVEDEVKLANSLQKVLVSEGYVADVAFDGETGFEMATVEHMTASCLTLTCRVKMA